MSQDEYDVCISVEMYTLEGVGSRFISDYHNGTYNRLGKTVCKVCVCSLVRCRRRHEGRNSFVNGLDETQTVGISDREERNMNQ